ncbi:unnamed protein product [Orchesella dallaii]|uniref:Uncharacterized protein n=1 Tax=Orchesella dallaii TaxID=48710 RepID=A0ABP1QS30_9HEXA
MQSCLFLGSVLLVAGVFLHNISSSNAAQNTGALTLGQSCNPSLSIQDDPSNRCDTSKRLSCDMRSRTCKCHHEERDFYNRETDQCETKVGKFCSKSETFPAICVNNAICDPTTSFCVCEEKAEANEDNTGCIKEDDDSNSATVSRSASIGIAALIIGRLLI